MNESVWSWSTVAQSQRIAAIRGGFAATCCGLALLAVVCATPVHAQQAAESDACAVGDGALADGRWSDANDAYRICVKANPSLGVYSNMGVALSHMGRMEEAIASYQKALALEPSNTKVEFNLSISLLKAGSYQAAVDHLKHLQRAGDDVRNDELLAFCYYHLNSYSLAARTAERVYATHPEDAANALILGSTYTRMGLYDKALPLIELALQAAGSAEGHLILAQTLMGLHQYSQAQDELKQVAAAQPDYPGLHAAMGAMYVGLDHPHEAETEFAVALKQDPNDFDANYLMGRLKRFDDDLGSANRYLAVADQLRPNSAEVAFERATIAVKEHRYGDAVPLLELVVKAQPDHAQAYLMLAESYQRTGRKADAQRMGQLYDTKRAEQTAREAAQPKSTAPQNP